YSATITGTTGPITAALVGLDGSKTQSIPLFSLPGLSSGAILLDTNATGRGSGTVTVVIHSLINGSLVSTNSVTVNVTLTPTASPQSVSTNEGEPQAITLAGTDPNSPALPLTFAIVDGPTHGSLGAITGDTVIYTPAAGYSGPDSFTFKVN